MGGGARRLGADAAAGDEALYAERAADFDAMGKAKFFFGAVGGATSVLDSNVTLGGALYAMASASSPCESAISEDGSISGC